MGGFIRFQSVLRWRYYNAKKAYRMIGGTTIQDIGSLAAMAGDMEPGVHSMSDELILQISSNIFIDFKQTLMMEIRPKYITLYDSYAIGSCVKSWPDLMTKQNWYTKTFPPEYDYRLLNPE